MADRHDLAAQLLARAIDGDVTRSEAATWASAAIAWAQTYI